MLPRPTGTVGDDPAEAALLGKGWIARLSVTPLLPYKCFFKMLVTARAEKSFARMQYFAGCDHFVIVYTERWVRPSQLDRNDAQPLGVDPLAGPDVDELAESVVSQTDFLFFVDLEGHDAVILAFQKNAS